MMEEYIENLSQLSEYYVDEEYNWDEIVENFKLTESFIRMNFDNLDKLLLLQNQDLSINFLFEKIKHFEIEDIIKYKSILDKDTISKLKEFKDLDLKKDNITDIEIKKDLELEEEISFVEDVEDLKKEIDEKNIKNTLIDKTLNKPKTTNGVDVEQLSIDRLRELKVDYNTIVGIHLSKIYTNKFNELKTKYEKSIIKFDDLILEALSAK